MKRVVLIFLLVIVAVPLVMLGIAHRQIRTIAPALPTLDAIVAALAVEAAPTRLYYVNTASQRNPAGSLGHPGVVIEWSNGRSFLIDTGMPPAQAVAFGRPIEWLLDAEPTQTFGSLADQLGEGVNKVAGVAFTHLHSDHTDGLPQICARQQTPATVFQTPLQYEQRNYTTDMGFEALAAARCARVKLPSADIIPLPGFPGLVAISLGGHTPGSTLYAARVGQHYWLFSGDITNDKRSLLEDLPKHWTYSLLVVPEDTQRTALLRNWLRALDEKPNVTVLPAHDVDVMGEHLLALQATP